MKRIGNLFEQIVCIDNLRIADEKARKGKKNTYGVRSHDKNRESNLLELHKQLLNGNFRTSEYTVFTIYEPKERLIYRLPYYPDRILHHAIMNILEPIWTSIFTSDTYACIKGRGIHSAAAKIKKVFKEDPYNCTYCLKIDIKKFYPSIKHDVLKQIIRKKIKDKLVLILLDEIIDSAPGLPIGNYLSQSLANLTLAYFDHWIKEKLHLKYYFRYVDDIVILHHDKKYLWTILEQIENYLSDHLQLSIKDNKQIFPIAYNHKDKHGRGIDFLGYVFYKSETLLRKRIKKKFCKTSFRLAKRRSNKECFDRKISSWNGWCKHCKSQYLVKKLNATISNIGPQYRIK